MWLPTSARQPTDLGRAPHRTPRPRNQPHPRSPPVRWHVVFRRRGVCDGGKPPAISPVTRRSPAERSEASQLSSAQLSSASPWALDVELVDDLLRDPPPVG